MIGARSLCIEHSDSPLCWQWISIPESRFPEVAQLLSEERIYIRAKIQTSTMSPGTTYAAYLVYKITPHRLQGFSIPSWRPSRTEPCTESSRVRNTKDEPRILGIGSIEFQVQGVLQKKLL